MEKRVIRNNENYFGHCGVKEHENYAFNYGSGNWMCCDECKIVWCIGENMLTGWRDEDEEDWKRNLEIYGQYKDHTELVEYEAD